MKPASVYNRGELDRNDREPGWYPVPYGRISRKTAPTQPACLHFRKDLNIPTEIPSPLTLQIIADTRYKLYVNSQRVAFGPVKGDRSLWFYDDVDIAPFLRPGRNDVAVHVLRLFHATTFALSFVRSPFGGLRIVVSEQDRCWASQLESSASWETAIDPSTTLRVDELEDYFLHIYEKTSQKRSEAPNLIWKLAMIREFKNSTGSALPWNLSPRLLPLHKVTRVHCSAVHKVESIIASQRWGAVLTDRHDDESGLLLPAGTKHQVDVEMPTHMTAFLRIRFKRPVTNDSVLRIVYSEWYEAEPESTPWLYACTLSTAAQLVTATGRLSIAQEYQSRAEQIIEAIRVHCYDGEFFADTLVKEAKPVDYSLHCQVWAVLSGTVAGPEAQDLLRKSLQKRSAGLFTEESVSMSFYTLRALSLAGVQFVSLYEFMSEVAGIRPAQSGWAVTQFRPRLGLSRQLRATVPLKMTDGISSGVVHISWSFLGGEIVIRLQAGLTGCNSIPVDVALPGQETRIFLDKDGFQWVIQHKDVQRHGA
ncbi:putative rhamnosidase B [Aspergillus affinis]|uniref:putative rhamnosidase B n=1 Tax=Aspergillus affinis TaxID=1070780 RepID=UPI0022FE613C|nr:uncharacterized protein KD926_002537 [Aspergillus affinis]KAI9036015.1 hypothetical protein KD926_002537 [Aspergillus affinis]